jgi:TRAP-type C4-dicarboxylate transport system permease small subunit
LIERAAGPASRAAVEPDSASDMKRFETILTHVLEGMMMVSFLIILVLVVTLVVLRYVFNSSITGANEIITVLFVYTTAIGAAVAVGKREHIAITFAAERLPLNLRKAVDAVGLLLIALINGVMLWYSVGWIGTTGGFLMPSTGLPRIVAQVSIPLGCGLAVLYCTFRLIHALTGEEELGRSLMRDE